MSELVIDGTQLFYKVEVGGTPGSPLPPPCPSGNSNSLPFPMKRFLDEKLLSFSWVPGG